MKVPCKCLICGKVRYFHPSKAKNKKTCSIECKNKLHSKNMSGEGNSMFNKVAWNKNLTKETDERVKKQGCFSIKNGNHKLNGGSFHGKIFWFYATEEQKEDMRQKISERRKKETWNDYNRAIRSKYGIEGFKDSNYRRYLKNLTFIKCETCLKEIKIGGCDGIYVHHRDKNHQNNKRENLKFVCPKCHCMIEHDNLETFLKLGWKKLRGDKI